MRLKRTKDGILVDILVRSRSKGFDVKVDDEILVFCRQPPTGGKANTEVVKKLSWRSERRSRSHGGSLLKEDDSYYRCV
ncbi:MAG: hypothetical protein JSV64_07760 [Candidatus Bathyarchaeota archaeon]|nr:MAG: hypothetical protein JSV64_07760 [Candidatus Bathyarchaeota archaeon]